MQVINNEVSSQERIERYALGGCFLITSRILIVDLLDDRVDARRVSGLLVFDAHRISGKQKLIPLINYRYCDNNKCLTVWLKLQYI
jgi:ERCC4-related helicase